MEESAGDEAPAPGKTLLHELMRKQGQAQSVRLAWSKDFFGLRYTAHVTGNIEGMVYKRGWTWRATLQILKQEIWVADCESEEEAMRQVDKLCERFVMELLERAGQCFTAGAATNT